MTARAIPFLVSLSAFIALWTLFAFETADPTVLPTPLEVLRIIWAEATDGPLIGHMLITLGRVAAAFAVAMVVGVVLGLVLGRSDRANQLIGPWVTIFLNIPALVVIVLCYLWVGLNEVAAILAVAINKTAMVTVTLREGTGADADQEAVAARGHRRRDRIAIEQLVDALVDALVHRFVEMMRLERGIELLHDLVVDQHRAKECGLRLDIAGQGLPLLVGGGSRIIGGEEEIGVGHARHHGRGSAAPQAKHVAKLVLSLVDSGDYRATP